jgi:hypothetical protein
VGPIPQRRLAGDLGRAGLGQGGPQPTLEMGHAGLVAQAGGARRPKKRGARCWATLFLGEVGGSRLARRKTRVGFSLFIFIFFFLL